MGSLVFLPWDHAADLGTGTNSKNSKTEEMENTFLIVLSIQAFIATLLLIFGGVGWVWRRKFKPVSARNGGLVVIIHVVIVVMLLHILLGLIPSDFQNLPNVYALFAFVPAYFNVYLWNGFRLLFIYKLSSN
jgi:hypothetical protein